MRLVWLRLVLASAIMAGAAGRVMAAEERQPKPVVALDFAHFGFSSAPALSDSCFVTMTLDRKTFLTHADEIKAMGLLNSNELPNKIDAMPDTLSMAFVLQTAPSVTEALYRDHPRVDQCRFDQYLIAADADGIDQQLKIFSFTFDRALYQKVDWSRLSNQAFVRVSHGFHFDRDFQKILRAEGARH